METWAIPLGALIVSLATLVFTAAGLRSKADGSHVSSIEDRLRLSEQKLLDCERTRDDLRGENLMLLQRLVKVEETVNGEKYRRKKR